MALLPQEKHKQIALLVGFLALAGLYGYFEYLYTPEATQVEELEARLEQLEDNNRRAQLIAARGGDELEERVAVYERHVRRLEELIPRSEEVPALLNSITTEAYQSRVELGAYTPEPRSPGQFYDRHTYEASAVGEYHDIAHFLTRVASLPRIITPLDLELTPFGGDPPRHDSESPVEANFRIRTYALPDPSASAEADELEEEEDR